MGGSASTGVTLRVPVPTVSDSQTVSDGERVSERLVKSNDTLIHRTIEGVVTLSHTCHTLCLSDPPYHAGDDSVPPSETNSTALFALTLALVLGVVPTAQGLA